MSRTCIATHAVNGTLFGCADDRVVHVKYLSMYTHMNAHPLHAHMNAHPVHAGVSMCLHAYISVLYSSILVMHVCMLYRILINPSN